MLIVSISHMTSTGRRSDDDCLMTSGGIGKNRFDVICPMGIIESGLRCMGIHLFFCIILEINRTINTQWIFTFLR